MPLNCFGLTHVTRDSWKFWTTGQFPHNSLFTRTGFWLAVLRSNCRNRTEAKGFASEKESFWPPVPLSPFTVSLNVGLARAGVCARDVNHGRTIRISFRPLRLAPGATGRLVSRFGNSDLSAPPCLVPCASRRSLHRRWFSSCSFPGRPGKLAESGSDASSILYSRIARSRL